MKSVKDRVLQLINTEGQNGTYSATTGLKSLAGELGITHEALYRTLPSLKKQRSFTGTIASYLSYGISGPKRWEFTTPDLPVLFCRGNFRSGSSLSLEWSAASLEDFFPAMKTPFICVLCRTDCANPLRNHCLYAGEISITRLYSPICSKLVCNTSPAAACHV